MGELSQKLKGLPSDKISDLETITQRIVETGLAEIVILYGSYARGTYKDDRNYVIEGQYYVHRRSDYDLLVVIDQPNEKREVERFYQAFADPVFMGGSEKQIRKALREIDLPVQILVEQITGINQKLESKQYFFADIKREGIELYNSGKHTLSDFPEHISPTIRRKYAEDHFEQWFKKAKNFLKIAVFCKKEEDYSESAFMLEQVVEMCYKCIALVYTHYTKDEHDLFKLRSQVEKYEPLAKAVFPLETDEQEGLFDKLNLCYIGTRYIAGFIVEKEEIDLWKPEVDKLIDLTEQTCKIKIESLKLLEQ